MQMVLLSTTGRNETVLMVQHGTEIIQTQHVNTARGSPAMKVECLVSLEHNYISHWIFEFRRKMTA